MTLVVLVLKRKQEARLTARVAPVRKDRLRVTKASATELRAHDAALIGVAVIAPALRAAASSLT